MQILHSNIIGQGDPILILHGFLGMLDNWKSIGTKYAEEGFEVHLIDQRNHGKSFHSEQFNYDVMAADLNHYMVYHKLPNAIILGHSMGGKTAMLFACKHPEMVKKLLVADIAPKFYPPHHQDIINGLNAIQIHDISSRQEADEQLAKYLKQTGVRQFLLKNLYWVEKGVLGFRFNLEVLSERMDEVGENIGTTDSYSGPTLFLRGDKSEYITDADLTEIKNHFSRATLVTISNAGHWLHAENPKQFLAKSIPFIKE
ncbi:Esterase YbfF [Arenibacter antarcticus]|uniref:Alpha/beta fold hydrolase n=1 Tax=Arenibacter antarcticus TaxID=2040469 RepID=A0ABW5VDI2_9FLAO|nr:alpha/beta fold hydrolase [Arenibacter sp. H213]MCM4169495.1 alpha/beta hydrolase [Arenibacter sp. H213]